ncbi:silent information regulator protein Sir2p [Xylona heveae TC161]|uniref:NAD-dependent protein deacetylase n=1 Tax=Xylona heveae (strain CBS 132557 / TC161) TaxID=1328760 RepID=A0A165GLT0_XYLHT|nr:silent information regulator protein Sir2p [Xylona heveae TC161]KZF22349.1 silent information regulator protein Sir2p [Xylona heveae TC161]
MGQESSTPVAEHVPPRTLDGGRTVEAIAKYIRDGKAKKIVVMSGAGISTSAGIPDFRSPNTGLYANLARLNLPYAEAVFDISYFRTNPLPFYILAQELYPGRYRPTITHSFIKLLSDKGLLLKHFTQNIDCLERQAGVPGEKIVEAHGSFARQSCVVCKSPYPADRMLEAVRKMDVPHCLRPECEGLVKPEIVFFGESLPDEFHDNKHLPSEADLCIVMGTSLTVQPFASLPGFCSESTPRVLINLEQVGSMGSRPDDVLILGDCDAGVRRLASALGWLDELEALWKETDPNKGKEPSEKPAPKTKDEEIEEEIQRLTQEVDSTLKFSEDHKDWLRQQLANKRENVQTQARRESREDEIMIDPDTHVGMEQEPVAPAPGHRFHDEGGNLSHVFPHLK